MTQPQPTPDNQPTPDGETTTVTLDDGTQLVMRNGNVVYVNQPPAPSKMKEGAKRAGRGIANMFRGQRGSVFWLIGRGIDAVKVAIESANESMANMQTTQQLRQDDAQARQHMARRSTYQRGDLDA